MQSKRFIKSARKMVRIILVRFRPLTVHTEAIFNDAVWEEIQKRLKKKKVVKWYVMTPENYTLTKGFFKYNGTKKELSSIMKKRYLEMRKQKAVLQLHVHLHPLMKIKKEDQEQLIKKSVDWFKRELGYPPREVVFGWWRWDKHSEAIARKYGLRIIEFDEYNSVHDYDWVIKCQGESYL